MEITRNHIHFYDAQKLRLAVRALMESDARVKLAERFLKGQKRAHFSWSRNTTLEDITPEKKISIHALIPQSTAPDSIFHRRARGRKQARETYGAGHHLQSNLKNFLNSAARRGEKTPEEALRYYCTTGGAQPYDKWARRWMKKLGWATPDDIEEWRKIEDKRAFRD